MGRKIMSAEDKLTIERLYQTTSDAIIGEIIGKSRGYAVPDSIAKEQQGARNTCYTDRRHLPCCKKNCYQ